MYQKEEELLGELIELIRPINHALEGVGNEQLEGTGVSGAMANVLAIASDHGPLAVPEIARHLGVERQHVQRSVNALVDAKMVSLAPNPKHKRSSFVSVTSEGKKLLRSYRGRQVRLLRKFAKGVGRKDVAAAVTVLGELNTFLQES